MIAYVFQGIIGFDETRREVILTLATDYRESSASREEVLGRNAGGRITLRMYWKIPKNQRSLAQYLRKRKPGKWLSKLLTTEQ